MTMMRTLLIVLLSLAAIASAQVDSAGIRLINDRKFGEARSFFEKAVEKNGKGSF